MNEFSEQIVSELAAITPFKILKSGKSLPVLLPFYHLVSDQDLPFRNNYNYPSVAHFEADLDFLLKNFRAISLSELVDGGDLSKCFHLSFDDGLKECYEVVVPILKRKGIPATFFINPSFVDNKDLFHRYKASEITALLKARNIQLSLQRTYADLDSLDEMAEEIGLDWEDWLAKNRPYMTLEQVKKMQDDGFTIGSHSMDHPEFELLDEETQLEEIKESMEWLTGKLSPGIKAFAFPFTDFGVSDQIFETCYRENIFDVSFGTAGLKKERFPFHFQRLAMDQGIAMTPKKRLKEVYMAYRLKAIFGKKYAKRF